MANDNINGVIIPDLHIDGHIVNDIYVGATLKRETNLTATLESAICVNDYTIRIYDLDNGHKRMIVSRSGEEEQILDWGNGSRGVGILAVALNDDYTLTISLDDGTSYTTPPIRGAKGDTPSITSQRTTHGVELYSDGALIGFINDGADGTTPVITGGRQGNATILYSDGVEIARITDGHSPVITASKADGVTHIYVDGAEIAAIADGREIDPDAIKRYVDGEVAKKQDIISDLTVIRKGAEKGATALQSVTADDVESALGYKPVKDVKVNGTSLLADGVANVPLASSSVFGVVKPGNGTIMHASGILGINFADSGQINRRAAWVGAITPTNLDYAVKSAMCDGKGAVWTEDEQLAAQQRLGLFPVEGVEF